jgi:hypothetical protein
MQTKPPQAEIPESKSTIAFLGPSYAGLTTVGIQFAQPVPEFGRSALLRPIGISVSLRTKTGNAVIKCRNCNPPY